MKPNVLPLEIADSYARLVRGGVSPAQLEPVRRAVSHPNVIVRVTQGYVAQASQRRFAVPVDFAQNAGGTQVRASGLVPMRAAAVVVPNDSRAEIRVDSQGSGAVAIDAARKRSFVRAHDDAGVSGVQSLVLAAGGITGERPRVNLATNLSLDAVCLNVRSTAAGKLLMPFVQRFASRELDAQSGRISAEGKRILEDRVADEGYDIAYRLNGLFQQSYWQRLAARDVESELHLRSTSDGIEGRAENGHAWQLGAPGSPPAFSPPADVEIFVHASAINNLAGSLAGASLSETALRGLIFDELKLIFDEPPSQPPRIPAVLQFAAEEPLEVSFEDGAISLTMQLSGCRRDQVPLAIPPARVRVAYGLQFDRSGLKVVRDRLEISPSAADSNPAFREVLDRFFPKALHSKPRFQNAAFEQQIALSRLQVRNGWLCAGSTLCEPAHAGDRGMAAAAPLSTVPALSAGKPSAASGGARPWPEMQLLFCFQGKGSCLSYDAGVLHESYARIPALREQRAIVAGNSSGSIMAAYFGCWGFSDENVRDAEQHLLLGDKTAVRNMENPHAKLAKMFRGRPTEISHLELREYIAFALGVEAWRDAGSIEEIVRRSRAECRFPCLIAACNKEVLEDRAKSDKQSARQKEIDYSNLTVSWRPEVYDFYRRHPERFAADHPDLKLGADRRIGKAVTFSLTVRCSNC